MGGDIMAYCLYLRKSRADAEAEAKGAGETLARHEAALLDLAKQQQLPITTIYKELVSGETIASRPVMQQLLDEVERGCWQGVLVMEITRLARGETIDQGIVAQAFKYSGTQIITPGKTYNPANEFDEEYFEFGLFMSRREYKMINQRQQRGRLASVREGKYVGNKPPFGYRRIKLSCQKGWTLEPCSEAPLIRQIFNLFTEERLGCSKIANRLNEAGIPTRTGVPWRDSVIRSILTNPVYAGWIRWGERAQIKTASSGRISKSRPRAGHDQITLTKGLHPAIIPQEQFDLAQRLFEGNKAPRGPQKNGPGNPLVGLITCSRCGKKLVKRPGKNGKAMMICTTRGCPVVGDDLAHIELVLLQGIAQWLRQYQMQEPPPDAAVCDTAQAEEQRQSLLSCLDTLQKQKQRIHELLEQDVYTVDVFLERSQEIGAKQDQIQRQIQAAEAEINAKNRLLTEHKQLIPQLRRLLDTYPKISNAETKNRMLKNVLAKAVYNKTTNQRWSQENDLTLTIYPKLPEYPFGP